MDLSASKKVIPGFTHISKRQTVNTNRAVCVIQLNSLQDDIRDDLKQEGLKMMFQNNFPIPIVKHELSINPPK